MVASVRGGKRRVPLAGATGTVMGVLLLRVAAAPGVGAPQHSAITHRPARERSASIWTLVADDRRLGEDRAAGGSYALHSRPPSPAAPSARRSPPPPRR